MSAIWNRINTFLLLLLVLMLGSVIAMFATVAHGGPLDPTTPPAPTDAVKLPGTAVSSLPFVITQPGHYYLTRSLTVNGWIAIDVQVNDVSLDLGGFTVASTSAAGSYGIYLGTTNDVAVRNGTVSGFQFGIQAGGAERVRLDDVHAIENTRGVELGTDSRLSNCTSLQNAETGIYVSSGKTHSVIKNCIARSNAGDGLSVAGGFSVIESSYFADNATDVRISSNFNSFTGNVVQGDILLPGQGTVVADNVCTSIGVISDTGPPDLVGLADHANMGC